jgi:uncharacterized coiled-coil protein SlyX
MAVATILVGSTPFSVPVRPLFANCDEFAKNASLVRRPYRVRSAVSVEDFQLFLDALEDRPVHITNDHFPALSLLANEFGFSGLVTRLSDYQALTESRVSVRISRLEARVAEQDREIGRLIAALAEVEATSSETKVELAHLTAALHPAAAKDFASPHGEIFADLAQLKADFVNFTAQVRAVFPVLGERRRPEITPELRATLMLMSDTVTPETSDDELFANADLGLELLSFPPIEDWSQFEASAIRRSLRVPGAIGAFFLECFAIDEPTETLHLFTKLYPRARTLQFALPVPIPIAVSSERDGETLSFGFFDSLLSADVTESRVRKVISALGRRTVREVRFEGVDPQFVKRQTLEDLSYDFDLRILVDFGRDVRLLILKTEWDADAEQETQALVKLYEEALAATARGGRGSARKEPLAITAVRMAELAEGE